MTSLIPIDAPILREENPNHDARGRFAAGRFGDHSIALPSKADRQRLRKTVRTDAKGRKHYWPWLNASGTRVLDHVKM